MKRYMITKSWKECTRISQHDLVKFITIIMDELHIYECEIFTEAGWRYVTSHLKDMTDKNVDQLIAEKRVTDALQKFFQCHLFPAPEMISQ